MASRYLHGEALIAARMAAGCMPVADVLREADLPADVLESTGLVFQLERRSWQQTATLSVSLKRWVFGEPWNDSLWIKPGGRTGFLDLVQGVLAGQINVEQLGAANRQTLAWAIRRKAKREAHMQRMARRVIPPLDPAMEAMVAPFVERWTAAAKQGMELYDNTDALGLSDLAASGLNAQQRHCILAKLRTGYFVQRTGATDDPCSGAWTFERLLPQQNIRVRALLRITSDDVAICERFHLAAGRTKRSPSRRVMRVDRKQTCERTMRINVEGLELESSVLGHPAVKGRGLFSSKVQDMRNIKQLLDRTQRTKGIRPRVSERSPKLKR